MKVLNSKEVKRQAEIERNKPKPKPIVTRLGPAKPVINVDSIESDQALANMLHDHADVQLQILEKEYYELRLERNKLSTQISYLVEGGATQEELAAHYQKIKSLRSLLHVHYDKINHFKKYGTAPVEIMETPQHQPEPPTNQLTPEARYLKLLELKDKKRKVVDKRSKLKPKLMQSAKPAKPAKILEWQQALEMANLEYEMIEKQIKELEGKA